MPSEFEKIFNECASKIMIEWNLNDFKNTHPTLFRTIMKSMQKARELNTTPDNTICNGCGAKKIEIQGGSLVCPNCENPDY